METIYIVKWRLFRDGQNIVACVYRNEKSAQKFVDERNRDQSLYYYSYEPWVTKD